MIIIRIVVVRKVVCWSYRRCRCWCYRWGTKAEASFFFTRHCSACSGDELKKKFRLMSNTQYLIVLSFLFIITMQDEFWTFLFNWCLREQFIQYWCLWLKICLITMFVIRYIFSFNLTLSKGPAKMNNILYKHYEN